MSDATQLARKLLEQQAEATILLGKAKAEVLRSLVRKLAEVMAAAERVPKRGRNDFHKYDYATEADIAATIRKELAARHVLLVPAIVDEKREAVGEKGDVLTTLIMEMEFLDGESGESIKKPWRGYGADKGDKGGYKAITGAEKYFLLKTFLIPTGDDPEREPKQPSRKGERAPVSDIERPMIAHEENVARMGQVLRGIIVDVAEETKVSSKGKVPYTKATITIALESGEEAQVTTLDAELRKRAWQYKADSTGVDVTTKETRWGLDIVTLHAVPTPGRDTVYLPDDLDRMPF